MNIVIVDDSDFIRRIVRSTLEKENHTVEEAGDGEAALALLESIATPDLLISDINMPGISGLQLVARLRQNPAFATLPVIMLTTESREGVEEESQNLNIFEWIVKPFQPDVLIRTVKAIASGS
ncbi:MAG: response regulator [Leptospiraceae bacterium]|nr:response regulator [Leptospiraceae bacterium]